MNPRTSAAQAGGINLEIQNSVKSQQRLLPYVEQEMPNVQAGFRKGRGTGDHIANIHWLLGSTKEFQRINLYFIEYSKAFDCVDHEKIWIILKEMGVPQHLIVLMCNLHCKQEATIRTEYGETEWFPIGNGIRQECILSPYLLNLYAEHTVWKAGLDSGEKGVKVGGRNIDNLRLVDNTILQAESSKYLK